jgi:hypothetical protein
MRDVRARGESGGASSGRRRGGSGARAVAGGGTPLVAGYRLIRLVGRGRSCEVHLGRAERAADPGAAANVAVKIVPPTERSRGEAEVVALQSVVSEHVVALRDVATLADGSLCIVQSLGSRGTAAALVARRGSLTPGETVTLTVSVLRGLGDLHEAGLAHGALDLTHVVIDETGRPMLGGLGSSRPLSGRGGLADPGGGDPLEQDLTRVSRIVQALRDPVDARGAVSDSRWDTWLELLDSVIHGESGLTAHDLADRLLRVADAAPLAEPGGRRHVDGVDVHGADTESLVEHRRGPGGTRMRATDDTRPPHVRAPEDTRAIRVGTRRHRAAREAPARRAVLWMHGLRGTMRRELGAVRPRVWAVGASALLLLVVGAVGLPLLADAAHGESAEPITPTSATGTQPDLSSPQASTTDSSEDPGTTEAESASVSSPDPDVAAPALLRLRAACLRRADLACVSTVDEAGSAAEDADRAMIAAGGHDRLDDCSLHVTDVRAPARRMGDGALVELQPSPAEDAGAARDAVRRTASLLVVRGEAGWRIRDLMDDR